MRHVFISYAREDERFVQMLRLQLEAAGFLVWRDLDIRAGEDWRGEIDEAIGDAAALVVIISRASRPSEYVNYEWAYALGANVKVVPVLLNMPPSDLHPALAGLQRFDFSDPMAQPWSKLLQLLKEVTDAHRPHTVRVPREAPPAIHEAARALDNIRTEEREAALKSLDAMAHPAVAGVLADALKHPVEQVRFIAAQNLARRGDVRALPGLREAILRGWEVRLSGWKMGKEAIPTLMDYLEDPDEKIRWGALSALGEFKDPSHLPVFQRLLQHDPAPWVRGSAARVIGRLACEGSAPALADALEDEDAKVRRAAAESLKEMGGENAVTGLMRAFADPDGENRRVAAYWAKEEEIQGVIPGLVSLLKDKERDVRNEAARALERLGDSTAVPALVAALEDGEEGVRYRAAEALQRIRDPAAVEGLIRGLQDDDPSMVNSCATALGAIGGERAVAALIEFLQDELSLRRQDGAEALGTIGDRAAVPALVTALADKEPKVRRDAAGALGRIRDEMAVDGLIRALEDDDEEVSRAAADALKAIGTAQAIRGYKIWRKKRE